MFTFYLVPTGPGKTKGVKGYRAEGSVASWAKEQGSLICLPPALAMVWLPKQQSELCVLPHNALAEVQEAGTQVQATSPAEQFIQLGDPDSPLDTWRSFLGLCGSGFY